MPPIVAQTPGKNHRLRKKPRRSDPTSSPPSLSDGGLPQKAFLSQSLNRAKTPYPGADSNSVANTTSAQRVGEVDEAATKEADGGRSGCDRSAAQGRLGRAGDR